MRERNLLYLFLALNVGLAGAFIAYLFVSTSGQPQTIAANFPSSTPTNFATTAAVPVAPNSVPPKTNVAVTLPATETKPAAPAGTNPPAAKPFFTGKKFTWEEVESEEYLKYIES